MTYRVNLCWTASINKTVEIEAETEEEARRKALDRCVEYAFFRKEKSSGAIEYESFIEALDSAAFAWDKPDAVEFFLEEEACEVID